MGIGRPGTQENRKRRIIQEGVKQEEKWKGEARIEKGGPKKAACCREEVEEAGGSKGR